jgi:hypothetical protein
MRNLIECTLVSLDDVFAGAAISRFAPYRDPWADRINAMPKYVFSSTLEFANHLVEEAKLDGAFKLGTRPMREERSAR